MFLDENGFEGACIRLQSSGFLSDPGSYVMVDGQFGSTGKGLFAAFLSHASQYLCDYVTTNAGPNSGHTAHIDGVKVVLKQLPMFAVHRVMTGKQPTVNVVLNGGAVIDWDTLAREKGAYIPYHPVWVDKSAAVISQNAKMKEQQSLTDSIGSTGQGVGTAIATKVMRTGMIAGVEAPKIPHVRVIGPPAIPDGAINSRVFVEVAQGFSLGINQGFYPYTTSRECTVSQALADAGLPPNTHRMTLMTLRTFPIRVGGNSGPGYPDQQEISWEELGVEPERTTVTNKIRRVFTWSATQYRQALMANQPDILFLNFLNYLPEDKQADFVYYNVLAPYKEILGRNPKAVFLGFGPYTSDIRTLDREFLR